MYVCVSVCVYIYIYIYIYIYRVFLSQSSVNRHLDYFHVLVIVNSAATNTGLYVLERLNFKMGITFCTNFQLFKIYILRPFHM